MNFRSIALAALSGILLAVSFPVLEFHLLAWIALLPLFLALRAESLRNGFWLGGIAGIMYFAGTLYWVANTVHLHGGVPIITALLITLLLCAHLALYPAIFGAAVVFIRENHPSLLFIAAPVLWTTLELARTYVFSGLPWSLLGYSQYRALPVVQIADITGVYGVSFLIVLVNAALAEFILDRKRYLGLISVLVALMLVLGYGFVKLRTPVRKGGLRVSVVQGNIEQDKKWDPAFQGETLEAYRQLTRKALRDQPDLVIWPETATPFYLSGVAPTDQALTEDLAAFVKKNRVPLLFGSPTYEVKPSRQLIGRNSAFLFDAGGRIEATYHKIHLVPFGEYVPFKNVLFFAEKMVRPIGDFQAGNEYTVMTVPVQGNAAHAGARLGTVICYEIIFPDLVRRFVDKGANVVATITNDAWFGRTAAPYQHFSMAVFRAVENRVPVARAANTGISGFIDSQGHILAASGIFTRSHLTRTIVPGAERTFYTRFGDLFSYACVLASIGLIIRRSHRTDPSDR